MTLLFVWYIWGTEDYGVRVACALGSAARILGQKRFVASVSPCYGGHPFSIYTRKGEGGGHEFAYTHYLYDVISILLCLQWGGG